MKVTVEYEDLERLLDHVVGNGPIETMIRPTLTRLCAVTLAAKRRHDHPTGRLVVDADGTMRTEHGPMGPNRWAAVAPAVAIITALVRNNVASIGHQDALGAYLRDTFDAFGLSVWDEDALFVALVVAGLMVEMAHNGLEGGTVGAEVLAGVAHIAQSLTAALIPYLPPEAKP